MLVGQWRSLDDNDVYIMAQAREQGHCHERVDYLSSWMSLSRIDDTFQNQILKWEPYGDRLQSN